MRILCFGTQCCCQVPDLEVPRVRELEKGRIIVTRGHRECGSEKGVVCEQQTERLCV